MMAISPKKWQQLAKAMHGINKAARQVTRNMGPYASIMATAYVLACIIYGVYIGGDDMDKVDAAAKRAVRAVFEELGIKPGLTEKFWEQQ